MVGVMESNLKNKQWMNGLDFLELFTIAQSFPGVLAINTAVIVGWRLRGFWGATAGFFGVIIPPVIIISFLSLFYESITESEYAQAFLLGIYGAMVGIVASLIYKIIKSKRWNIFTLLASLMGTVLLSIWAELALPIFIVLVSLVYMGTKKWMP